MRTEDVQTLVAQQRRAPRPHEKAHVAAGSRDSCAEVAADPSRTEYQQAHVRIPPGAFVPDLLLLLPGVHDSEHDAEIFTAGEVFRIQLGGVGFDAAHVDLVLFQNRHALLLRLCQRLGWGQLYLPDAGEFIGHWRLRDWLRLLGFELETISFGCYRPAATKERWLQRHAWMESLGARWWPILGAAYFVVAVKRVHGMRLLEPAWRSQRQRAGASVPLVSRAPGTWAGHHLHKD